MLYGTITESERKNMKFAAVSHIRDNLPALNAVPDAVNSRGINEFIFVGDFCLSGLFPDQTDRSLLFSLIESILFPFENERLYVTEAFDESAD